MSEHHINYKKIYYTLLVLLFISVAGPFLGIFWVTLITAFGIAVVKANLVIQNFMHLRAERRLIKWMLVSSLVLMALLVAGVAPDVFRHEGQNWVNTAAKDAIARGVPGEHHDEEGEGEETALASGESHDDAPAPAPEASDGTEPATFDAAAAFNGVCAACHGAAGDGQGPAAGALNPPPANFTDPDFWASRDDARLIGVITNGAASVGGSASMAGWSSTYSEEQIEGLVEFIKNEFRPR